MVRAEAGFAWHLKRGQQIYSSISHRELRLLAELGHLRPDDLLWRPGLGSWTSVSSVPGVPPLLPPRYSQTKQWDLTKIGAQFWTRMSAPFLAASNDFCRLILSTRQHAPSIKGWLQLAYNRVASNWRAFNLIEVRRHGRPRGGVADRASPPARSTAGDCGRLAGHGRLCRGTRLRYEVFLRNRQ